MTERKSSRGERRPSATRARAALAQLERLKFEFGPEPAREKVRLLALLEAARLGDARAVARLHEVALVVLAYPDDLAVAAQAELVLDGFERRADLRRFRGELADSGIAGTAIRYP